MTQEERLGLCGCRVPRAPERAAHLCWHNLPLLNHLCNLIALF